MTARKQVGALIVSAACLVGIAGREGFRAEPYHDSGGVLTDGYGNTKNVKPGTKITPDRALVQLLTNVNEHASGIRRCFGGSRLHQHEFDAYVDLAFNIGIHGFCKSSIPEKVKAERYEDACKTILMYDKITKNGKKVSCHDPKNNCKGIITDRQRTYRICTGAS